MAGHLNRRRFAMAGRNSAAGDVRLLRVRSRVLSLFCLLLSCASLLLCMAVTTLWVRSHWTGDSLVWTAADEPTNGPREFSHRGVSSQPGSLVLFAIRYRLLGQTDEYAEPF